MLHSENKNKGRQDKDNPEYVYNVFQWKQDLNNKLFIQKWSKIIKHI